MAQFLQPFIDEVIVLTERGICNENGSVISVKIVGFCCDAPAKKDILGIKVTEDIHLVLNIQFMVLLLVTSVFLLN